MLKRETPCESCNGTSFDLHQRARVPVIDGVPDMSALRGEVDPSRIDAAAPETCATCAGHAVNGVTYARYRDKWTPYGDPYKSVSTLKAALTRGKATVCKDCTGTGRMMWVPVLHPCYSCEGTGKTLTWDAGVQPIVPEGVGLTHYMGKADSAAWLAGVTFLVQTPNRGMTWGESYLGMGSIYSCTDYGRSWEAGEASLIAEVREHMAGRGPQLCQITNSETRRVTSTILITSMPNGYTVAGAHVDSPTPALPPTYYPPVDQPL